MFGFSTTLATEARRFWQFAIELHQAKIDDARDIIDELREEIEAMALHSDFPSIRRACQGVLTTV